MFFVGPLHVGQRDSHWERRGKTHNFRFPYPITPHRHSWAAQKPFELCKNQIKLKALPPKTRHYTGTERFFTGEKLLRASSDPRQQPRGRSCLHVALAMAYGKMMDVSYLQPSILPACLLCHLQVSLGEQIVLKSPNSFGSASTWHSALYSELQESSSGISPNQPVHFLWPNLNGEAVRTGKRLQWTWHGEDARLVASTHTFKALALGSTPTFLSFPVPGVGNTAQN